ncbi:MAG TPA: TadE/TadG family type IV pilus assembly protein [Candidatus Binatus sp.]|uniref:TadE/TadG family type IV pilus assembly protein n=1 Tax=Candidatus Binatus sp. TaxID=2811406 RepID=UPI002F417777
MKPTIQDSAPFADRNKKNGTNGWSPLRSGRISRGQSAVEFALISVVALVVMLVGIQFALIGQAALAVSQASYLGARAASVDATLTSDTLSTQISSEMSPTITGATVTLTPTGAATCGPPRTFGCPFTVAVTYDASSKIFLPSNTLLGITFPTSLTFSESAMTE